MVSDTPWAQTEMSFWPPFSFGMTMTTTTMMMMMTTTTMMNVVVVVMMMMIMMDDEVKDEVLV